VLVLTFVVLGSAGGTCWAVFFRTVASPVSLRQALRLYRRHQDPAGDSRQVDVANGGIGAGTGTGAGSRPLNAGVYGYRTSGGERLSLLDQSRSFPDGTDMMVVDGSSSCSVVTWLPLVQHTETTTVCSAAHGAVDVTAMVTHEVISGSTTTTVVDCPATLYLVPPIAVPGVRWSAVCHQVNPAETVTVNGEVIGAGPLTVDGDAVQALHVRLTLGFSGVDQGIAPTDYWISTARGLLLREQESAFITQAGVHYTEQMDAFLTSLAPLD